MERDSSGMSYWTLRRKIRQQVESAMAAFNVHVSGTGTPLLMRSEKNESDDFSDTCLSNDGMDADGGLFLNSVHSDEGDYILLKEFSESSSEEMDDVDISSVADISLEDSLIAWVTSFSIPATAVTALLKILHIYLPNLPRDARTLMKTPRTQDVRALISGGELWYHGIATGVEDMYRDGVFDASEDVLGLQISVDGLPLFKSSGIQLWPILCRIVGFDVSPFVVAVYCGVTKPADVSEYLADFVEECKILTSTGIVIDGSHFKIVLHSFVCDAPARAFLKCIKNHNGYFGCERCCVQGNYQNCRMIFVDYEAPLRTDDQFVAMTDEDHHVRLSPLAELPIGLVSGFVLDPMHLLYLGVMRKLLHYWVKGPLVVRLGSHTVSVISERLVSIRRYIPREFARRSRSIADLDRWKATEFKLFLLYCGVVVLKDMKCEDLYNNFLLLFVSSRILSSHVLVANKDMCDYAESLLKLFVQHAERLYGRDCLVYNMHSLIHLVSDVRKYGSLDNISAFAFENKLKSIKRMVRKPQFPLQQIVRRLTEAQHQGQSHVKDKPLLLKRPHFQGPLIPCYDTKEVEQFGYISCAPFMLSLTVANNCALTVTNEPIIVCNILSVQGSGVILLCRKFSVIDILFDYPVSSKDIQVYKVSNLKKDMLSLSLHQIKCKCLRVPLFTQAASQSALEYAVLPLLHQC